MTPEELVIDMIEKARIAQRILEKFSQEEVDAIVRACAKAVDANYVELANLDNKETKMGNLSDKLTKTGGRPKAFWYHMKNKKSRGIIRRIDDMGLVEIAKPMGVIGCISPVTSPVITPLHNTMCALKCGNSIVICPHPSAKKTGMRTVELMNEAINKLGAPENLIQIVSEPTMDISKLIMESCDVCISTGGPSLIKVAYSSGKPAFGVGAGNCQCLIDRGMDIDDVAAKIISSKMVENGIPCGGEQFAHCPEEEFTEIVEAFKRHGAYYFDTPDQVALIRDTIFPDGELNKSLVGKLPYLVAREAGIEIPEDTKLLAVKVQKYGGDEHLAKEKLFPVIALRSYDTWEEAVAVAEANLAVMGKGHSTMIHSNSTENIEYAAVNISVCRFGVNQSSSKCVGGTLTNGLAPTGTLGCGSWGNNSISENLDYHHLMNISRIVYELSAYVAPIDAEIWAE